MDEASSGGARCRSEEAVGPRTILARSVAVHAATCGFITPCHSSRCGLTRRAADSRCFASLAADASVKPRRHSPFRADARKSALAPF